jgi:hypothetical protein
MATAAPGASCLAEATGCILVIGISAISTELSFGCKDLRLTISDEVPEVLSAVRSITPSISSQTQKKF